MAKKWNEGTALAVRPVLAGAYRGRDVSERALLTHAVLVDGEGDCTEEKTVCRKVLTERLGDLYGLSEVEALSAPTCPECALRSAR